MNAGECLMVIGDLAVGGSNRFPITTNYDLIEARARIVSIATAMDAPFVLFVGSEIHLLFSHSDRPTLDAMASRTKNEFERLGIETTVLQGAMLAKHLDALGLGTAAGS